jgi:hypothetical protein
MPEPQGGGGWRKLNSNNLKYDSPVTSRNPSPKHRNNKNHESNKIKKHKKNLQT